VLFFYFNPYYLLRFRSEYIIILIETISGNNYANAKNILHSEGNWRRKDSSGTPQGTESHKEKTGNVMRNCHSPGINISRSGYKREK
jgi:hypothetical protein